MLRIKAGQLLKGALTCFPGAPKLRPDTGSGTRSATYCYGLWLKHVTMLWQSGMRSMPQTVAELGPGNSLGTGLAAMLSGADHYRGLDIVEHSATESNLRVFDQLVRLFRRRAPRPTKGWPDFDAYLGAPLFPSHVLSEDRLEASLAPKRIAAIREAIISQKSERDGPTVRYITPWSSEKVIRKDSIDVLISHAVLAEVDALESTYRALHAWLKPGGFMSHQIGMGYAGFTGKWNGYWTVPDPVWKIIRGRRPYLINRIPASAHLELMRKAGFDFVRIEKGYAGDGVQRSQLSGRFKSLSDDDLSCQNLFVQARKKYPGPGNGRLAGDCILERGERQSADSSAKQPAPVGRHHAG